MGCKFVGIPQPKDYTQWLNAVLQRTEGLNIAFRKNGIEPLPFSEVKAIASSIAKFTFKNFNQAGFSAWQSEQGRKGGLKSGEVRRIGSIEEAAPWVDLGISRATWYRRNKSN